MGLKVTMPPELMCESIINTSSEYLRSFAVRLRTADERAPFVEIARQAMEQNGQIEIHGMRFYVTSITPTQPSGATIELVTAGEAHCGGWEEFKAAARERAVK
ncbi:MAG TPA: hypothetical protein VGK74_02625 [Symbiobacteriaceae bacterium]|jgi:hypothetical protein